MGHTLTTLTGEEDEITEDSSISDDIDSDVILVDDYTAAVKKRAIQIENLPSFVFDASIDPGMYILIFTISHFRIAFVLVFCLQGVKHLE